MTEAVDRLFWRMKGNEVTEAGLLQTPQVRLEKPLLIESSTLEGRLYLCANEDQARDTEAKGGICYLPAEVRTLIEKSGRMDEAARKDYLNKMHMVKRTFPGSRVEG